jgi:hypothetical protein
MDPKHLDDLARSMMDSLPKGFQTLQADVQKNMQGAVQAAFARMNLVTREEFDVQAAVLARTRQKLERLEKQVAELERLVNEQQ